MFVSTEEALLEQFLVKEGPCGGELVQLAYTLPGGTVHCMLHMSLVHVQYMVYTILW